MISRLLDLVAIYNAWSEMILYGSELANCHISANSFRRRDRVRKLFKGGNYLMEETIRGKTVAKIWEDATAHRVWPNCAMTLIWCFRCPRIFLESRGGAWIFRNRFWEKCLLIDNAHPKMSTTITYLNSLEICKFPVNLYHLHFKD